MNYFSPYHFPKYAIKIIAFCIVSISFSTVVHAQVADSKRALASRAIAAQEGPEMQRMFSQLADSAVQPLIARWNERVVQLPAAKQEAAVKNLDAELKKFNDDAMQIISAQASKIGDVLVTAYADRFSEEELKQLVAMMEAPVFKKYQSVAPELGNIYVKALVDSSRDRITQRSKVFDTSAEKIVGAAPAAAPAKKP